MNFEQSLKRLDEIIAKLENNEISLEESIEIYREGTDLVGKCRGLLDSAELLVTVEEADTAQ
ncbi:MAG: exodeoxyribonuclease VII small subunit [Oscillospiraceae bacterium]|jgi:exodeoxyribonuclease VII small subunit|nr:exodeoxyribonuclease VII small subunit [Oscillospiraceae bacterium]MCX4257034.1 exodeoxyribonuclease VII small subunit [Oscillospiraceae bacterium]